jgi:hypothetical protein
MPSFFQGLKRLVLGEPVFTQADMAQKNNQLPAQPQPMPTQVTSGLFTPTQPPQGQQQEAPMGQGGAPIGPDGSKVMPVVLVNEVKCHWDGRSMECYGVMQNMSAEPVELDKIMLLGVTHNLDHFLNAGEEHELLLYSGQRPTNTSQTNCKLQYKNHGGDYFEADYYIEYDILADGTCDIKRLRFIPPVRDI